LKENIVFIKKIIGTGLEDENRLLSHEHTNRKHRSWMTKSPLCM
jgi:hypothetical protein